jgi:ribosomal protein L7/L12
MGNNRYCNWKANRVYLINTNIGEYKMKLDKMTFAQVIAHVVNNGMSIGEYEIRELDRLIDIHVEAKPTLANPDRVEDLLKLMNDGRQKIEAIKVFRDLTGAGLKESKDAIERHWNAKADIV